MSRPHPSAGAAGRIERQILPRRLDLGEAAHHQRVARRRDEIVGKLHDEVKAVLALPEIKAEFARTAPAVGEQVALEDGDGVVVGHQVPADSVVIRMSASGATRSCSLAAACGARQLYASRATSSQVQSQPRKPRTRRRRSDGGEV